MSGGFRLAAVQRMRARRLEETGRALVQARQALVEAAAHRDLLVERLLGALPTGNDPTQAHTVAERRALLRERIAVADAGIAELSTRVAAAREGWLTARADLRAVDALHERYRQARRTERDRREQRLADDLAAVRHRTPTIGQARERDDLSTTGPRDGGGDAA
jgi:flagellar export protein FliJ